MTSPPLSVLRLAACATLAAATSCSQVLDFDAFRVRDAGPDAVVAVDVPAVDAASDLALDTPPDLALDTPPDVSSDATPDVTLDATLDTEPDVTFDATLDTPLDLAFDAPPDRAVDAPPDLTFDAPPDLTFDAPPDRAVDAPPLDVAPDVPVDTARVDATVDGAPDASRPDVAVVDAPDDAPAPRMPPAEVIHVASGGLHSCALLANGSVWCWGDNAWGQLGVSTSVRHRSVPAQVTFPVANEVIVAVTAGPFHTCALARTNRLYCWGRNDTRQSAPEMAAEAITSPTYVSAIAAVGQWQVAMGRAHTCALAAGVTYCWGETARGQCGISTSVPIPSPTVVSNLPNATTLAGGDDFTCALLASGEVRCWGDNASGQLAAPLTTQFRAMPTRVVLAADTTDAPSRLVAGPDTMCVRTRGGRVDCWGRNHAGQVPGSDNGVVTAPVRVQTYEGVEVSLGREHQCVWNAAGNARCWGENFVGQLGNGTLDPATYTAPVTLPGVARTVTAGSQQTCAVLSGVLRCWGALGFGGLGNGLDALVPTPFPVPSTEGATRVVAGAAHACALVGTGAELRCWGYNRDGQAGAFAAPVETTARRVRVMPGSEDFVAGVNDVAAGRFHTCARGADGAVRCFGRNTNAQLAITTPGVHPHPQAPVPVGVTPSTGPLVAGWTHNLVRVDARSVLCWGEDVANTCGLSAESPARATPVQVPMISSLDVGALGAGRGFNCAAAGPTRALYCWGRNDAGQAAQVASPIPSPVAQSVSATSIGSVTRIALGERYGCVLSNRGVWCWGSHEHGALGTGTTGRPGPVAGMVLSAATALASGASHSCAVVDRAVRCWGNGHHGQNGSATWLDLTSPTAVAGLSNVTDVTAGDTFSCAIADNTTGRPQVHCWGSNHLGQVGNVGRLAVRNPLTYAVRWP